MATAAQKAAARANLAKARAAKRKVARRAATEVFASPPIRSVTRSGGRRAVIRKLGPLGRRGVAQMIRAKIKKAL